MRKYIGVVLKINDFYYFAPLSSFKEKHKKMKNTIDFIKIKELAVINLNNMFPVPLKEVEYYDISLEKDIAYKNLLQTEYRFVKKNQEDICKKAFNVYKHKIQNGNKTNLSKRCVDFKLLEKLSVEFVVNN